MSELDAAHARVMQTHLHVLSRLIAWSNFEFEDLETALQALVEIVHTEMGYQQFGIGLAERDGSVRFTAGFGVPPHLARTLKVVPGQGIAGWVMQHGEPLLVPDVAREPRYRALLSETRSELCVPLQAHGRILGIINVESPEVNAFTEHDVLLLVSLANGASGVVARLLRQTQTRRGQSELFLQLSAREKQILRQLAQSKSNAEIANALHIKIHTVEHHITSLLKKLQVSSRHEAAQLARAYPVESSASAPDEQ